MDLTNDPPTVRAKDAFLYWLRLGFINFGGPAGQMAIMHKELVNERKWISETQFFRAVNFCMILPGPEAQQLATYIGWRLHGTLGGIVAGASFVIPSMFVLWFLSWTVVEHAHIPIVQGLLYGVQPVVIGVVVEAVLRIGKRTLHNSMLVGVAVLAFVAVYVLSISFPIIVLGAAMIGLLLHRFYPSAVQDSSTRFPTNTEATKPAPPPLWRTAKLVMLYMVMLGLPVFSLILWVGKDHVFVQEAVFFTKAAFVTFGGAYAVLSYIADVAVDHYAWLTAPQMIQGLALAESTPGPLIMVTQFVGFVGAWTFHADFDPLVSATLGALISTYVTFLPCFFFIFVGAPYIEFLARNREVQAALVAVTAAIVGVILNLALFFGRNVLFPAAGEFDLFGLLLAVVSFGALYKLRIQIHHVVIMGSLLGMTWRLIL